MSGPLNLSSQGRNWDGWTVLQVKHKEEPTGRKRDAEWLVDQLRREINEWRYRAKRPDQLLIVTNVALTPASHGGEELVDAFMEANGAATELKAWAIWHADQVCRLLDNHPKKFAKLTSALWLEISYR